MNPTHRFLHFFIIGMVCATVISVAFADDTNSLREAFYSNRLLAAPPQLTVSPDGIVTIQLETTAPCSSGKAYLGIYPRDAELKYPVYRASGKVSFADANSITVAFKIGKLEVKKVDINGLRKRRGGRLAYRVVLCGDHDAVIDRTFAYYRTPTGEYRRAVAMEFEPLVDQVSAHRAVLSWQFDHPAACTLEIQPGDIIKKFAAPARTLEIPIEGLQSSTEYTYQIHWEAEENAGVSFSSPEYTFRTAPAKGSREPFRFVVFSDSRASYGGGDNAVEGVNRTVFKALLTRSYLSKAAFVLVAGDLVSGTTSDPQDLKNQFDSFKRIAAPIGARIPIYESVGNHDLVRRFFEGNRGLNYAPLPVEQSTEALFAAEFVNPHNGPVQISAAYPPYDETVYSFDWGNVHVAVLNDNYFQKGSGDLVADLPGELQGTMRPEQLDWLDNDLQAARERGMEHLFVAAHEPAFPTGGHVKDAMWWKGKKPAIVAMRNRFWKILCKYRVLAAFFGHEHNYSRTLIDAQVDPQFDQPVWQIITGAGGAPFYARDEDTPWAKAVSAFYPLAHCCIIDVAGKNVNLTVETPEGLVVDRAVLTDSLH